MQKAKLAAEHPDDKWLVFPIRKMYGPTGMYVVAAIILCVSVLNKVTFTLSYAYSILLVFELRGAFGM